MFLNISSYILFCTTFWENLSAISSSFCYFPLFWIFLFSKSSTWFFFITSFCLVDSIISLTSVKMSIIFSLKSPSVSSSNCFLDICPVLRFMLLFHEVLVILGSVQSFPLRVSIILTVGGAVYWNLLPATDGEGDEDGPIIWLFEYGESPRVLPCLLAPGSPFTH